MQPVPAEVEQMIVQVLKDRLDGVVFTKIYITPDWDDEGDEYLLVDAIVDDKQKWPETEKTIGLIRHMRPKLAEVGTEAFPIISFLAKSKLGKAASKDFRRYRYGYRFST